LIFGIPPANEKAPAAISVTALFHGVGGIDGSDADVGIEKAMQEHLRPTPKSESSQIFER
jgi:hypothetical protein